MEFLDKRQASFKPLKNRPAWTHTAKYLQPKYLAQLGFYRPTNPATADLLVCTHCGTSCDWKGYDHPLKYHLENQPCEMARIWGSIKGEPVWTKMMDHSEPFESVKEMIANTFAGKMKWPYGPKKKQSRPTWEEISQAGFVYLPISNSSDHTMCPYCEVSLDGWEASDDVVHEHKRRNPECGFFKLLEKGKSPKRAAVEKGNVRKRGRVDLIEEVVEEGESPPKAVKKSKGNAKSKGRGKAVPEPESGELWPDNESDHEVVGEIAKSAASGKDRKEKSVPEVIKKVPVAEPEASRKTKSVQPFSIVQYSDSDVSASDVEAQPVPAPKAAAKKNSKKQSIGKSSKGQNVESKDVVKAKGRKKKDEIPVAVEPEGSVSASESEVDEPKRLEPIIAVDTKKRKGSTKKSTAKRTVKRPPVIVREASVSVSEDEDTENSVTISKVEQVSKNVEPETVVPKNVKKTKGSKAATKKAAPVREASVSVSEGDGEVVVVVTKKLKQPKGKATRGVKSAVVSKDDAVVELVEAPKTLEEPEVKPKATKGRRKVAVTKKVAPVVEEIDSPSEDEVVVTSKEPTPEPIVEDVPAPAKRGRGRPQKAVPSKDRDPIPEKVAVIPESPVFDTKPVGRVKRNATVVNVVSQKPIKSSKPITKEVESKSRLSIVEVTIPKLKESKKPKVTKKGRVQKSKKVLVEIEPEPESEDEQDGTLTIETPDESRASTPSSPQVEPNSLFEKLLMSSTITSKQLMEVYEANKHLRIKQFMEVLSQTAVDKLDAALTLEIDTLAQQ